MFLNKDDIYRYFLYFNKKIKHIFEFIHIQKRITILVLGLIVLFFISIFSLNVLLDSYENLKYEHLKKNELYLRLQESRLNTISSFSKENESLQTFLKKKHLDTAIKNSQAQKVIEKIKRQLHLESCKVTSGSDTLLDKELNIYSKKITFDVQSNTDQKFYQLIDRLHHQLPGLIVFKRFFIQENEAVKSGKSSKNPSYLFQGKIECQWIRQKQD